MVISQWSKLDRILNLAIANRANDRLPTVGYANDLDLQNQQSKISKRLQIILLNNLD